MKVKVLIAAALLTAVFGCPPDPVVPEPELDAGLDAKAPACVRACAQLAKIGCLEGADVACVATCQHAQDSRVTDMHPECLAAAGDKQAARACGSVECP
jgi:hypothetical protein